MMKRLFTLLNLLVGCYCLLAQIVPAPTIGDFQSKNSGAWKTSSTWQIYTATGWQDVSATPNNYPGLTNGNYKVFINPQHQVTISGNTDFYFGDLYILSSVTDSNGNFLRFPLPNDFSNPDPGTTVNVGQLTIASGNHIKLLGDSQNLYIYGGKVFFEGNQSKLSLLEGNSLVITNYSTGAGANTPYGVNGVQPVTSNDCMGQMRIYFQNSSGSVTQQYAICYANAGQYTFHGLNSNGGSLHSIVSASRNTVCTGESISLYGEEQGLVTAQVEYRWVVVSQPVGSTLSFPSTFQNLPIQSQNITFNIPGVYELGLETRYLYGGSFYVTSLESVDITVNPTNSPACGCYKDPVLNSSITIPSKFGVASLTKDGLENPEWLNQKQSAAMVLESKSTGLVINRVADVNLITHPVEGMIVFDTSENCLKIYKVTTSSAGWKCIQEPGCPTL